MIPLFSRSKKRRSAEREKKKLARLKKSERLPSLQLNRPRLQLLLRVESLAHLLPRVPREGHLLRVVLSLIVLEVIDLNLKRRERLPRNSRVARMKRRKNGISSTLTRFSLRLPLLTRV